MVMNLLILHPRASKESARKLSEAIPDSETWNPFDSDEINPIYGGMKFIFNYGTTRQFRPGRDVRVINNPDAVKTCIDKIKTFEALKGIVPIPKYTTKYNMEQFLEWGSAVVSRMVVDGKQLEGYDVHDVLEQVPNNAKLYTSYFHHKKEMRVVVFKESVIARYSKETDPDNPAQLGLMPMSSRGYKNINEACIKAAQALKIDYVGFDVLVNSDKDFVILEANSGPIITDDVIDFFKFYFQ